MSQHDQYTSKQKSYHVYYADGKEEIVSFYTDCEVVRWAWSNKNFVQTVVRFCDDAAVGVFHNSPPESRCYWQADVSI